MLLLLFVSVPIDTDFLLLFRSISSKFLSLSSTIVGNRSIDAQIVVLLRYFDGANWLVAVARSLNWIRFNVAVFVWFEQSTVDIVYEQRKRERRLLNDNEFDVDEQKSWENLRMINM